MTTHSSRDFPEQKSRERVQKYGEVLTPDWMVREMIDTLEQENSGEDIFRPETVFFEPCCGRGPFLQEVLRRKLERCKAIPGARDRKKAMETAACSVYGIEIQEDNVRQAIDEITALCGEYFKVSKEVRETIANHIILGDCLKIMMLLAEYTPRFWFAVPGVWIKHIEPGFPDNCAELNAIDSNCKQMMTDEEERIKTENN